MKEENKKAPVIRFEGFTDEWEQRKIFELGEIITGNTPSTANKDYYEGQYLFVSPADIQDNRYVSKTNTTLTELGFKTGRLIRKGSTLFVSIGSTIGKVGQADLDLTTNQQINSIIPSNDCDDNFVYSSLLGKSSKIKQLAATQAVPIINKTEFGKTLINVPNSEEQQKIGTFFKQLDDTIILHQRKLELLKKTKQGYLQKMFPKNGEDRPEIRFAGFADSWEQRKLGTEASGVGTGKSKFTSGLVKSFDNPYAVLGSTSVISYDREFDHSGDFVLTARVGANAGNLYKYSGNVKISDNTVYIQANNLDFVYYLLTKFDLKRLSFGTGQPLVKASELKNLKLMFPKDKNEQQKIGAFFKHLDDTLTLHQRKLDKLKNLKKAYLQNMFI